MANTSVVCCTLAVVCGMAGKNLRSQIQMSSVSADGGGAEGGDGGGGGMHASHQPLGDIQSPW